MSDGGKDGYGDKPPLTSPQLFIVGIVMLLGDIAFPNRLDPQASKKQERIVINSY